MSMDDIFLAHITDTHLFARSDGSLMGVNTEQSLLAVLADIRASGMPFAAAIATGDLVHDETILGYERLRRHLETLAVPVFCVPGNHDDAKRMASVLQQGLVTMQRGWSSVRWHFRFLNSAQPGEVAGRLFAAEVGELAVWLSERHEHDRVVVGIHHPPLPVGSAWLDRIGLIDPEPLLEVLTSHPSVAAMVCGHVHQEWEVYQGSMRCMTSPSTCAQFKPGSADFAQDQEAPGWRWLRCLADGSLQTGVRRVTR